MIKKGRFLSWLLVVIFLTIGSITFIFASSEKTSMIREILDNKKDYDGRRVTVEGRAKQFTVHKNGRHYTTFTLSDENNARKVLKVLKRSLIDENERRRMRGSIVEVSGTFYRVMEVGRMRYRNAIEASSITLIIHKERK